MTEPRDPLPLSAEAYIEEADRWARIQPADEGTVATAQVYATLAVARALAAARSTDGLRSALEPGDGNASQDGPQPEAEAVFPKGRGCPQCDGTGFVSDEDINRLRDLGHRVPWSEFAALASPEPATPCQHEWEPITGVGCFRCDSAQFVRAPAPKAAPPTERPAS